MYRSAWVMTSLLIIWSRILATVRNDVRLMCAELLMKVPQNVLVVDGMIWLGWPVVAPPLLPRRSRRPWPTRSIAVLRIRQECQPYWRRCDNGLWIGPDHLWSLALWWCGVPWCSPLVRVCCLHLRQHYKDSESAAICQGFFYVFFIQISCQRYKYYLVPYIGSSNNRANTT